MSAVGQTRPWRAGQSLSALPLISDVNLLRNGQGVIYLDTQIPNGALDLSCVIMHLGLTH
jgi:hypothetical protein